MLRFHPIANAKAAEAYYSKSDGNYYLNGDLRQEWLGKGAEMLGLSGTPDFEHFKRLIHGYDPHTGEQLTAKLVDNRIPAWDVTASVPKGVTIALERGDSRVQEAIWASAKEALADLEGQATTRVRKGGQQDDRLTGNLVAFAVEHPETRPAKSNNMPDPDRHIHMVVFNLTRDETEGEWKAVKFRPIMDERKYFSTRFDLRLASKLTDLGYGIETKLKADDKGGKRFFSWDIKDMPESVVKKFSRRTGEVEKLADDLGVHSTLGKDKLGATSRQFKRKDLTLDDYRAYWDSRVTPDEARQIAEVIKAAMNGENPIQLNTADDGMRFAISHLFERRSVVKQTELEIAAMERCMGAAVPEEIMPEAVKQGVLTKEGQATTKAVLDEESFIIAFAREGRGTMRPLKNAHTSFDEKSATLSPEQQAMVSHVLTSPDRMVMVIGDAGTGKTRSIKAAFEHIHKPIEMLAPSADASRGVLRSEGFSKADTVASFINDAKRQAAVKNGVIWVDEAGLLAIRDLSKLTDIATTQNARLVLQGDPKQHRSVVRHGDMMNVLQEHAGLPVGRLTEVWRQKHKGYKGIVEEIASGKRTDAINKLADLGWVKKVDSNAPLVEEYLGGLEAKKDMLIVAPTHIEGDEITATIRTRLKEKGVLKNDEKTLEQLVPLNWSEAERGDLARYEGTEVLCFHRNSGTFKAGQTVRVADFKNGDRWANPSHFSVHQKEEISVAAGDMVRFTAGGKTLDGHRFDNGSVYRVKGFDKDDNLVLNNGWTVKKDFGHLTHGYVQTSHAAQGKTVDRVLIAMGSESKGAINAEQFYVSVSRGKESAKVFSDMDKDELKRVVQRTDERKSATELMQPKKKPKPKRRDRVRKLIERVKKTYERLRQNVSDAIREPVRQPERDMSYGR